MDRDLREVKETIETVRADLSQRDEELLKIRIRIRQADMERERLEAELRSLSRVVGKQSRGKNA